MTQRLGAVSGAMIDAAMAAADAAVPRLSARVRPHQAKGQWSTRVLAFAELMVAGAFVIKGIRILQHVGRASDAPFVVYPAERGKGTASARWYEVAHPCTPAARAAAEALILAEYQKAVEASK